MGYECRRKRWVWRYPHRTQSGTYRTQSGKPWCVWLAGLVLVTAPGKARADADLLLEQPINLLGDFTSTGHAVLLDERLCSDDHVSVRLCGVGETGSVIGRYPGTPAIDWIAMTPQAYLFGVKQPGEIPAKMTKAGYAMLVNSYSEANKTSFAEPLTKPAWVQLVGASYRRRIIVIHFHTTVEQDERLMVWLNRHESKSRFNFLYRNCADFARNMLDELYPGMAHRDFLFDAGFQTPKQLAVSLHRYEQKHPELDFELYALPQIPGDLHRSGHLYGVTETFAKTKWYFYPIALTSPIGLSTVIVLGWSDRRYSAQALGKTARVITPGELVWARIPALDQRVTATSSIQ
jgi:hypothetical protein